MPHETHTFVPRNLRLRKTEVAPSDIFPAWESIIPTVGTHYSHAGNVYTPIIRTSRSHHGNDFPS